MNQHDSIRKGKPLAHTYTSDVQVLIQFAKDQGWDLPEVVKAFVRLEAAIEKDLTDYSIPEEDGLEEA